MLIRCPYRAALPAGRFTLTASKAGFVDMTYGAKRPGRPGTAIQLADGQKLDRIGISMPRGSVLTGVAPSNVYTSADGVDIVMAANADSVFRRLCAAMGQPALADDPRYREHGARGANMAELPKSPISRPCARVKPIRLCVVAATAIPPPSPTAAIRSGTVTP